jgi:coenzyme F420-reducing hydrogenase alpha subunit
LSADLEGRIDIGLTLHGGDVGSIAIKSSRPRLARKLMTGATPQVAAERAGLIFSLCGKAQRIAAEAACEAALGQQPALEVQVLREQRVLLELAQEHAWHLLLNWPRQAGQSPDMASLLSLRQVAADVQGFGVTLQRLLQEVILGEPVSDWLERDLAGFDAWREQALTLPAQLFGAGMQTTDQGISHVALLPPLQQLTEAQCLDLAQRALANEDFCVQPEWAGKPAETGAVSRMRSHALLDAWITARGRGAGARLLARLLELAELPQRINGGNAAVVRACRVAEQVGMSAVETSRGLLIHVVRLADGVVADYRIVAPTEWNFHPAGALVDALSGLTGQALGDQADARAQAICQSLDPCVAFGVEVFHA